MSDPIIETLSLRRIALGLPKTKVAAEIGVTRRALQFYEDGVRHPNLRRLRSWARALGCDLLLVNRSTKRPPKNAKSVDVTGISC